MAAREIPTPETLRQLLRYEAETGKLFWLPRRQEMFSSVQAWHAWNTKYANKEITGLDGKGYLRLAIFEARYIAHRVAWAIHYGEWPKQHIDHLNGCKTDNRIENLRDCNNSINHRNQRRSAKNTSGVTGVRWEGERKRWSARIKVEGKEVHLGRYRTIEEAADARRKASARLGFTARHGTKAKA